jgi:hypothetical protein
MLKPVASTVLVERDLVALFVDLLGETNQYFLL